MRTFADGDCELARTLKLKERELDAVTRDLSEKLVARATVDSELLSSYLLPGPKDALWDCLAERFGGGGGGPVCAIRDAAVRLKVNQ
jgi:hypothetical protein